MIKGINPSGRYVQVSGGSSSTYINNYSGAQGVGNMRYNTANQNMEVFDGNNWQMLNMGYATVGLNHEAEMLLDWAREQKNKELARLDRITKNPALKKAYEAILRAEENFDFLDKIAGETNCSDSEPQTSS